MSSNALSERHKTSLIFRRACCLEIEAAWKKQQIDLSNRSPFIRQTRGETSQRGQPLAETVSLLDEKQLPSEPPLVQRALCSGIQQERI